jgi:hypothetical protein
MQRTPLQSNIRSTSVLVSVRHYIDDRHFFNYLKYRMLQWRIFAELLAKLLKLVNELLKTVVIYCMKVSYRCFERWQLAKH